MPTENPARILGIIPARGGSKGVPRKNIRLVAGVPLLAYTIWAAQQSRKLTYFVTSTDDQEIAAVARQYGSPVILRPPELAADDTPMVPVVEHALTTVEQEEAPFDCIVVLQPTAPQRTGEDIDAALALLVETGADSVVSVYEVGDHHPARMYRLSEDGRLIPYAEEPPHRLRQALPPVYHRNGAIYACRRSVLIEHRTLIGLNTQPYIMPRERSINIDDELDLAFADFVLRQSQVGQDKGDKA